MPVFVVSLIYSAPGLVILVRNKFVFGPFSLNALQLLRLSRLGSLFTAELYVTSGQQGGGPGNGLLA